LGGVGGSEKIVMWRDVDRTTWWYRHAVGTYGTAFRRHYRLNRVPRRAYRMRHQSRTARSWPCGRLFCHCALPATPAAAPRAFARTAPLPYAAVRIHNACSWWHAHFLALHARILINCHLRAAACASSGGALSARNGSRMRQHQQRWWRWRDSGGAAKTAWRMAACAIGCACLRWNHLPVVLPACTSTYALRIRRWAIMAGRSITQRAASKHRLIKSPTKCGGVSVYPAAKPASPCFIISVIVCTRTHALCCARVFSGSAAARPLAATSRGMVASASGVWYDGVCVPHLEENWRAAARQRNIVFEDHRCAALLSLAQ